MGLSISSLFSSLSSLVRWSKDQDVRILMLGLDSAGKVRYFDSVSYDWLTLNSLATDNNIVQITGTEPLSMVWMTSAHERNV